jgi:MFS family permease
METISLLLILLISAAALTSSFHFLGGFFPRRLERVQTVLEKNWKRSFWLGLVNILLAAAVLLGLAALGDAVPFFFLPGFALAGLVLTAVLFGLSALSSSLGARLFPDHGPFHRLTGGAGVMLLSLLTPIAGWFLLLPYALCLALGSVVLAVFQDRNHKSPESAQED